MNDINKFKQKIESLLPILKKAYIAFYGKDYEERINSVIDSIKIVFLNDKELCKDIDGKIISINTINNDDIGRINNAKKGDAEACVIPHSYPPIVVLRPTNKLLLHVLIHEINHTLHNEREILDMGIIKLPPRYHEGIKDTDDDLIYEIINEYMTYDIMEILNVIMKNENVQLEDLNYNFNYQKYVYLDQLNQNKIKDFYEQKNDEIKKYLILARGDKILSMNDIFYEEENDKLNNISNKFKNILIKLAWESSLPASETFEAAIQYFSDNRQK